MTVRPKNTEACVRILNKHCSDSSSAFHDERSALFDGAEVMEKNETQHEKRAASPAVWPFHPAFVLIGACLWQSPAWSMPPDQPGMSLGQGQAVRSSEAAGASGALLKALESDQA
ncbi:hypothetical protein MHYP_G00156770 [Metynnis hypsauchen]